MHDPSLESVFRDLLRHYGVVAYPARVGHPDHSGNVEGGIGHA